MARSMTGYGAAERRGEHGSMRVEVRSVNHRFLDVQLNLPPFLLSREAELKAAVGRHVRRARVDLWVSWELAGDSTNRVVVDRELAAELHRELDQLRRSLGVSAEVDAAVLARFPEAVHVEPQAAAVDDAAFAELLRCADEALGMLDDARVAEGRALVDDVGGRIDALAELVERAQSSSAAEPERIRDRLAERVQALLDDAKLDPQRLHQEVAFVADRVDVAEELTRLRVHLDRARKLLGGDGELGKPLDFLVQELSRETNTLGAKSRDPETAEVVLAMKAAIEKIKEQARNLE